MSVHANLQVLKISNRLTLFKPPNLHRSNDHNISPKYNYKFTTRNTRFYIRNHFERNLHAEGHNLKELEVLKAKFLRKFSISNIFITANNQELGSRFYSMQSNSHEL